jgi:hypothetical protein
MTEKTRIKTPGFTPNGTVILEQVRSGKFAIHEKLPDNSWRTREAVDFPEPNGKGILAPLQKLLWPAAGMPIEYGEEAALFNQLMEFFQKHEPLRDTNSYETLADFTFLTYRLDFEFPITPYLNPLGPKGTGKTRLLELLAQVCYRGWLVTHPSPASVFFVVDRYSPTLLADNYEYWAPETRRELDGLFNAGYRAGTVVPRRPRDDSGENELELYKVFCPKVISGTRVLSDALDSRCLRIRTARATEATPMFIDETTAAELRGKLLAYRFKHFENPIPRDESIKNQYWRVGEIFYPLLTVAPNEEIAGKLADFAKGIYSEDIEEEASSFDADVVKAVTQAGPLAVTGKLTIANILDAYNNGRQEDEKINGRRLGWALKRLGFKKTRLGDANNRAIQLDKALLEHLQRTYNPQLTDITDETTIPTIKTEIQPA